MPTWSRRFTSPTRRRAGRPLGAGLGALADWLSGCAERARQRRALARLDDRLLRDVGLSPADVRQETHRPPWRP